MFGLFGKKKAEQDLATVLADYQLTKDLPEITKKIVSFRALNRMREADELFRKTEHQCLELLKKREDKKGTFQMLALFYCETGADEKAEQVLSILTSGDFHLDELESQVLSGELLKLRRKLRPEENASNTPTGITQIYCCPKCGRLRNFASMPCPHCDWSPKFVEEMAFAMALSNAYATVPDLLTYSRARASGVKMEELVEGYRGQLIALLRDPQQRKAVENVQSLLEQNQHKNHFSIQSLRECTNCGREARLSDDTSCEDCGEPLNFPQALRLLHSIDNILWYLETRSFIQTDPAYSELICLLVLMSNNILVKQELPTPSQRKLALDLLAQLGSIFDTDRAFIVNTKDPLHTKAGVVKERITLDLQSAGKVFWRELKFLVERMDSGVHPY